LDLLVNIPYAPIPDSGESLLAIGPGRLALFGVIFEFEEERIIGLSQARFNAHF
jgi:hypothetical protein